MSPSAITLRKLYLPMNCRLAVSETMSRSSRGSADPEPPQRLQVEINLTFNASAFNTFQSLPGLAVPGKQS